MLADTGDYGPYFSIAHIDFEFQKPVSFGDDLSFDNLTDFYFYLLEIFKINHSFLF